MISLIKKEIEVLKDKSIFCPNIEVLTNSEWEQIVQSFVNDYNRYYNGDIEITKIKYFPGLLATFFYRISRYLYLSGKENEALEFSGLGFSLTTIELYYSADIGEGFKINHGMSTVVGSRTKVGRNCMLHQSVTIGEKNGGRATLGDNVVVYPGAVIVGNVYIGDESIIGANVFVDKSYPKKSKIK